MIDFCSLTKNPISGSFFPSDNFPVQGMSHVGVICVSQTFPQGSCQEWAWPTPTNWTDQHHWLNFGLHSRGGKMRARLGGSWLRCSGNVFNFPSSPEKPLWGFSIQAGQCKHEPLSGIHRFFSLRITHLQTSSDGGIFPAEFLGGIFDFVVFIFSKRQPGSDVMHKRAACWELVSTGVSESQLSDLQWAI